MIAKLVGLKDKKFSGSQFLLNGKRFIPIRQPLKSSILLIDKTFKNEGLKGHNLKHHVTLKM